MLKLQSWHKSIPKIFDQFICSSLAVPLINFSRDSSNFEKFVKIFTTSCLLTTLTKSECSRIRYIILIGQLTGSFESFKEPLQNFEKLVRAAAKLSEQMNWSNIFGVVIYS